MPDAPAVTSTDAGEATTPATTPQAAAPAPTEESKTRPWGDDQNFDPDRAWSLIENLRTELEDTKTKRGTAEAKVKEFEDAKLSDQEKATRALDEARGQVTALQVENAKLQAIAAHPGLTADDIALIGGTTPDEIATNAAKLAERLGASAPTPPPSNRPSQALRGGGDPTTSGGTSDWLRDAIHDSNR